MKQSVFFRPVVKWKTCFSADNSGHVYPFTPMYSHTNAMMIIVLINNSLIIILINN